MTDRFEQGPRTHKITEPFGGNKVWDCVPTYQLAVERNMVLDDLVDILHNMESQEMFSSTGSWHYDDVYAAIAKARPR